MGGEVVHKAFTSHKKPGKTKLDGIHARKKLSVKEEVDEEEDLFDEDPAGSLSRRWLAWKKRTGI